FVSEIRLRLTEVRLGSGRGDLKSAAQRLSEAEELVRRGIKCGALADPWNMLGFQGLFPLFQSREDSVHDPRIDELIALVADSLESYSVARTEAAARGNTAMRTALGKRLRTFATWWDTFAGHEVRDLRRVHASDAAESAEHVADALARWQQATGEAAADSG